MKVLLINGSPRPHGCTYTALKETEKTLNEAGIETEIFHIGAKAIQGCTDCGACAGGITDTLISGALSITQKS